MEAAKIEDRDFMQAPMAACALVGAADGDFDTEERATTFAIVESHQALKHFGSEATTTLEIYIQKINAGGRSAKAQLLDEIADVRGDEKEKRDVFLIAFDVAEKTGGVQDAEEAILREIARVLGVNYDQYAD